MIKVLLKRCIYGKQEELQILTLLLSMFNINHENGYFLNKKVILTSTQIQLASNYTNNGLVGSRIASTYCCIDDSPV